MSNNPTKKCPKCNQIKPVKDFSKNKCRKDGLSSYCKCCIKILRATKYKQRRQTSSRKYYEDNKEQITAKNHNYYKQNTENLIKYQKNYRKNNKEQISKTKQKYYKENKQEILERIKQYKRYKRKTSSEFRIIESIRARIHSLLKSHKTTSSFSLLGCSIDECRKHLEAQFVDGMSWDNYGKFGWHIDHIRPCASFDLTDPEQQKECFHYTNLQPLWAKDNLSKGSKFN
jgi:hypothetical protein